MSQVHDAIGQAVANEIQRAEMGRIGLSIYETADAILAAFSERGWTVCKRETGIPAARLGVGFLFVPVDSVATPKDAATYPKSAPSAQAEAVE